jgi:tetratricopeptide (TPR) repeat protein
LPLGQLKPVSFADSHIYQQSVKFLLAFASAFVVFVALLLTPSMAMSQTTPDPCDEQATCQAQKGSLLLAQGRVEEAAVALEKALLLDPNLPGAQLDYAQALALIGLKGSARAMLADVLQRPDIQPNLKTKLAGAQIAPSEQAALPSEWQWSKLAQVAVGHETNLNSAAFTDSLTLMLSNGPVTIGLADSAKPMAGPAAKTLLALQGSTRAGDGLLALGELTLGAFLSNKNPLQADALVGIKPERSQTAEAVAKFSLPMIAGAASGQWQFSAGATQFWLSSTSAYSDTGFNIKFNWDRTFEPGLKGLLGLDGQACKLAPSVGQTRQTFPLSGSLDGVYAFARMELLCKGQTQESQVVLGSGSDKAQNASRPGGDKKRQDLLIRHERLLPLTISLPWRESHLVQSGQLSVWMRRASSTDAQIYSELLGELKTSTHRTDWGVGFWVPLNKAWSAGLNLEATSQKSNNTLFQLRNSGVYAGIRWSEN